jgi:hypothetical protein
MRYWQGTVIHDRDSSYSEGVDATVAAMGLTILKDACAGTSSERALRTADRHDSPRVPGLAAPIQ